MRFIAHRLRRFPVELYLCESTLLERARKARDLVQVQYEKGAASLLDLLNAQRTYTATHGEYAQDLANYWIAVSLLEQATARELKQ